jgi:hypothetical protein
MALPSSNSDRRLINCLEAKFDSTMLEMQELITTMNSKFDHLIAPPTVPSLHHNIAAPPPLTPNFPQKLVAPLFFTKNVPILPISRGYND